MTEEMAFCHFYLVVFLKLTIITGDFFYKQFSIISGVFVRTRYLYSFKFIMRNNNKIVILIGTCGECIDACFRHFINCKFTTV